MAPASAAHWVLHAYVRLELLAAAATGTFRRRHNAYQGKPRLPNDSEAYVALPRWIFEEASMRDMPVLCPTHPFLSFTPYEKEKGGGGGVAEGKGQGNGKWGKVNGRKGKRKSYAPR